VPPFLICALPRSRTKWLSAFLTYGDWQCGHEEIRHARSMDDLRSWLAQPCTGTAETAAAPFWRLALKLRPDIRIVTVRRSPAEVVESLLALRLGFDREPLTKEMQRLDHKLDQIEQRVPGVLAVRFDELPCEATCARLFEHCLPYRHDPAWWGACDATNIQISMPMLLRYYDAHKPQLAKMAKVAKQRIIAGMARETGEIEGVTFQVEPMDVVYRDAAPLFAEHLVQTGQSPDDHARKNLPLLRSLDSIGALQIMTARSNGRIFGYLMSIVAPSLDSPDMTIAEHTIFFASPDIRGLGMKLQRAALDALRSRGVDDVLMRAGVRGSGPRLGTIYRRLGAEDFGQLYRLSLTEP